MAAAHEECRLANPTYPAGLPSPLIEGTAYTPTGDNVLRTQFPGATKVRRRQSAAPEVVSFSLMLTRAQALVLYNFVFQTLKEVLPFDWVEFRDPARGAATYRFRSRPHLQPKGNGNLWQADIELDLLTPFTGTFSLAASAGLLATDDDEILST